MRRYIPVINSNTTTNKYQDESFLIDTHPMDTTYIVSTTRQHTNTTTTSCRYARIKSIHLRKTTLRCWNIRCGLRMYLARLTNHHERMLSTTR